MLAASRAEDGCVTYSYGEDVAEPGLIRVFEVWRDQAAIDAHFKAPHMAVWRAACAEHGVSDRRLFAYETASERRSSPEGPADMTDLLLLPGDGIGPEVTAQVRRVAEPSRRPAASTSARSAGPASTSWARR